MNRKSKKKQIAFNSENETYIATFHYDIGKVVIAKDNQDLLFGDRIVMIWNGLTVFQMKSIEMKILAGGFILANEVAR
ncbi:MAG: hypothetical protein KAW47_11170 [Thermoplasmatales archaeon]|nr:hypothetical protein [Thermoplasmatales archaeon]